MRALVYSRHLCSYLVTLNLFPFYDRQDTIKTFYSVERCSKFHRASCLVLMTSHVLFVESGSMFGEGIIDDFPRGST